MSWHFTLHVWGMTQSVATQRSRTVQHATPLMAPSTWSCIKRKKKISQEFPITVCKGSAAVRTAASQQEEFACSPPCRFGFTLIKKYIHLFIISYMAASDASEKCAFYLNFVWKLSLSCPCQVPVPVTWPPRQFRALTDCTKTLMTAMDSSQQGKTVSKIYLRLFYIYVPGSWNEGWGRLLRPLVGWKSDSIKSVLSPKWLMLL